MSKSPETAANHSQNSRTRADLNLSSREEVKVNSPLFQQREREFRLCARTGCPCPVITDSIRIIYACRSVYFGVGFLMFLKSYVMTLNKVY